MHEQLFGMISNEVSSSFYSLESIALSAERKELERRGREKTRKEEGPSNQLPRGDHDVGTGRFIKREARR